MGLWCLIIASIHLPRTFVSSWIPLAGTRALCYHRLIKVLNYAETSLLSTMEITQKEAKSILTPQHHGFLAAGPYPFTHALSGYIGCGFGQTTCGLYCYAQFLPNWSLSGFTAAWGQAVQVKMNAPQLLDKALRTMKPALRHERRSFMSSTTDPYQPRERNDQVTP